MSETKLVLPAHQEQPRHQRSGHAPFIQYMPIVIAVILLLVLLCLFWYTIDVLLLVFTGILLALFLLGLSDELSRYTRLRGRGALLVVLSVLLAIFGAGIWFLAPQLTAQIIQLTDTLPQSI